MRGLLLLLAALPVMGQLYPVDGVRRARVVLDAIYSLDHPVAEKLCWEWIGAAPEDPGGYVYLARTIWSAELSTRRALSLERYASDDFFTEDQRYRLPVPAERQKAFDAASLSGIAKAKARLAKDPNDAWARFLLGTAYQNESSLEATFRHNWWTAFRKGTNSYRTFASLLESRPEAVDARLVTGIYRYVAGAVPWKVKWLTTLLGFSGSMEGGRGELEQLAAAGTLNSNDARTLLALLYVTERNFGAAATKLRELRDQYPRNYLVVLDLGSLALEMGQAEVAVRQFGEILAAIDGKKNGFERMERATVLNHLGTAERAAGRFAAAVAYHEQSLRDGTATARSRAVAHLETGKVLDLQGKRKDAVAEYRQVQAVAEMPQVFEDARRLQKEAYRGK